MACRSRLPRARRDSPRRLPRASANSRSCQDGRLFRPGHAGSRVPQTYCSRPPGPRVSTMSGLAYQTRKCTAALAYRPRAVITLSDDHTALPRHLSAGYVIAESVFGWSWIWEKAAGAQNVPTRGRNMLDVYVTVRGEDLAVDPAAESARGCRRRSAWRPVSAWRGTRPGRRGCWRQRAFCTAGLEGSWGVMGFLEPASGLGRDRWFR